jgi:site-specific recombinase XerD
MTIDAALALFEAELGAKSPRTLKTYTSAFNAFRTFLAAAGLPAPATDVTALSEDHVRQFLLSLYREPERYRRPPALVKQTPGLRRAVPPLAERTVRTYVTAASRFVSFLAREGIAPLNLEVLREKLRATRRRYAPSIPSVGTETIERIVAHVKAQPARSEAAAEVKRCRDIALVVLLARTGLRLSEVCALLRRDIRPDDSLLLVRGGKGGKDRVVDVNSEVVAALRAYWRVADAGRAPADTRPLADLPAIGGHDKRAPLLGPISPKTVERIIAGYVKQLGLGEKITPHSFRHGFATTLVENDVNLRLVQELLGHADLSTTQVYAHISDRDRRDAYRRVFGRWGSEVEPGPPPPDGSEAH